LEHKSIRLVVNSSKLLLYIFFLTFVACSGGGGGGGTTSSVVTKITLSGTVDTQTTTPTGVTSSSKVVGATVHIVDSAGHEVQTTSTDSNGSYSAQVSKLTVYGITVDNVAGKPLTRAAGYSSKMKSMVKVGNIDTTANVNPGIYAAVMILQKKYGISIGEKDSSAVALDGIDLDKTVVKIYAATEFQSLADKVKTAVIGNVDPLSDPALVSKLQAVADAVKVVLSPTTVTSTSATTGTKTSTATGTATGTSTSISSSTSYSTITSTSTGTGAEVVTVTIFQDTIAYVDVTITSTGTGTNTGSSLPLGKYVNTSCGTVGAVGNLCMAVNIFNLDFTGSTAVSESDPKTLASKTCNESWTWGILNVVGGVSGETTVSASDCPNPPSLNVPQTWTAVISGNILTLNRSGGTTDTMTKLGGDAALVGTWKNFNCSSSHYNCNETITVSADGTLSANTWDTNLLACSQIGIWYSSSNTIWAANTSNSCLGGYIGMPSANTNTYSITGSSLVVTGATTETYTKM